MGVVQSQTKSIVLTLYVTAKLGYILFVAHIIHTIYLGPLDLASLILHSTGTTHMQ